MYLLVEQKDTIQIPPDRLSENLDDVIEDIAKKNFEEKINNNMLTIIVKKVERIGEGKLIYGDSNLYVDIKYKSIAFKPELQEVVEGIITDVVEVGAFVNIGGLEGLVHISQIIDDKVVFDGGNRRLVCKKTKKDLKVGDRVRVRIVTLSLNLRIPKSSRIGLTMRQLGLGKLEWIEEERKKTTEKIKKKNEKNKI